MRKTCVKVVEYTGKQGGKQSVHLSTLLSYVHPGRHGTRVKAAFIPQVFLGYSQALSPAKISLLPLIEHYFYPVSTAPINTPIKERN